MAAAFEHQVCKVLDGRVCEVNGQWQGKVAPDYGQIEGPGFWQILLGGELVFELGQIKEAIQSCPETWKYLQDAGSQGWELVAVTNPVDLSFKDYETSAQTLYLKRSRV